MIDDDEIIVRPVVLLYAFRYALGRMTSAVGDIADELIAHRDALPRDFRQQIVQDIHNALEDGRGGHACDVERWQEVARAMA